MNDTGTTLSPKAAAIRAYIEAGFVLIPCNGKIPAIPNWGETPVGAYNEGNLLATNYGVVLLAGNLVIDVDPRNFAPGDKPLTRLVAAIGSPISSFIVRTGGGGLHIYLRIPADFLCVGGLKDFPGIEFKSIGRQVIGVGSVHESGKEYVQASAQSIREIADAPTSLLALIKKTAVPMSELGGGTGEYKNDAGTQGRFISYLQDAAEPSVQGKGGDNNAFKVACHGRDLGLPPVTVFDLLLEFWNPRCSPPWDDGELKAKVLNAFKFAKGAVGAGHPSLDFDVPPPAAESEKPKETELAWVIKNDKVVKCLQNVMNYLRLPSGGLHKIFAKNEFTGRIEFVNPAPWHRGRLPTVRGVGDHDLQLLRGYLASRHGYDTSICDIEDAITNVAYHERFHPVREYLESLKWDGKPRINTWLKDYLGAVDGGHPEYLAAVSRKVLCAAVMRVMRPGVMFHHVLVLEGAQDAGKSATCKILGGEWASDATVDPHSRDTVDAMQGRWILELAELEWGRKTEEDAVKAFITRSTDRARLAYGRTTSEFPRQSIFIATKNPGLDGTYLKDQTGNRRWWPVRCEPQGPMGQIDFKGLQAARNQLFAEAVHVVKTPPGEKLSMDTAFLKDQAKSAAGLRHAEHEWLECITTWISRCDEKVETRREFLTSRDIFVEAIGGSDKQFDRRSALAIAGVMRSLGWKGPNLKWVAGRHGPVRGYNRPGSHLPTIEKISVDNLVSLL